MLSLIIKPWLEREKANAQIQALDDAIREAERLAEQPLDAGLEGVERFDCAVRLLDTTLAVRLQSASPQQREQLVDTYLDRLQEEYTMAKSALKETAASRAEVVALGVAVKEIAVSLDKEIAAFRAQADGALAAYGAGAEQLIHVEVEKLRREFRGADAEGELALAARPDPESLAGTSSGSWPGSSSVDEVREAVTLVESRVQSLANDLNTLADTLGADHDGRIRALVSDAAELREALLLLQDETRSATADLVQHSGEISAIEAALADHTKHLNTHVEGVQDRLSAIGGDLHETEARLRAEAAARAGELGERIDREGAQLRGRIEEVQGTASANASAIATLDRVVDERLASFEADSSRQADELRGDLHRMGGELALQAARNRTEADDKIRVLQVRLTEQDGECRRLIRDADSRASTAAKDLTVRIDKTAAAGHAIEKSLQDALTRAAAAAKAADEELWRQLEGTRESTRHQVDDLAARTQAGLATVAEEFDLRLDATSQRQEELLNEVKKAQNLLKEQLTASARALWWAAGISAVIALSAFLLVAVHVS